MKPFQEYQKQFVEYLRDPEHKEKPAYAPKERIQVYENLLINNVNGFVETAFPVLQSIIPAEDWKQLVRQFFINHPCSSPFFVDISKQFLDFLAESEQPLQQRFPYLTSLAHYEWLELAVSIREDSHGQPLTADNLMSPTIALANTAEPASYQFPVHKISEDNAEDSAVTTPLEQPVYLVLYRKLDASEVNFLEVNAVTALACSFLQNKEVSFKEVLEYLHQHMPQFDIEQLQGHLSDMLLYLGSLNIAISTNG
jgi:hypothetical protein